MRWKDGLIQLGTGEKLDEKRLLSWQDTGIPREIGAVGVGTDGVNGQWFIYNAQGTHCEYFSTCLSVMA